MKEAIAYKYNVKEIFNFAAESFYDIYIHDQCEDFDMGLRLFEVLKSPEEFLKALKEGFGPCCLPDFFELEEPILNDEDFVVIVYGADNKIWTVVNGRDIEY